MVKQEPFIDLFPTTSEVVAVTRGIRVRARACVTSMRSKEGSWESTPRLVMYNVQFSHVLDVVCANDTPCRCQAHSSALLECALIVAGSA